MKTTRHPETTPSGIFWRGRTWRFAGGAYVPAVEEIFPSESAEIERAAERGAARVEAERKKLLRPDGSAIYMPAEHAERDRAILEQAGAAFDAATERFVEQADREQEKAERALAMLDGGDPFDKLSPEDQARAATRLPIVREDCETLPAYQLAPLARAAVAGNDRATAFLYYRYLDRRLQSGTNRSETAELAGLVREVGALFDDPQRSEKRRKLERRIEAAKSLRHAPRFARGRVDGGDAQALAGMRQQMQRFF